MNMSLTKAAAATKRGQKSAADNALGATTKSLFILPQSLSDELREQAHRLRQSQSAIVRDALRAHLPKVAKTKARK